MRCDREVLWTLVEQQPEPDPSAAGIYHHVASCQRCQQALDELAGGKAWQAAAGRWLGGGGAPVEEDPPGDAPDPGDELPLPIDLHFLQQPSHPELLGRLDRYEIESVIGRGGMGLVLRGYDPDLQRTVAIKALAPEWAASEAARRRFARESQAAASVAHENVIPIYNVQSEAQPPFLVMRYIAGNSLQRYVEQQGPVDPSTILRIAAQLAAGLSAAHAQGLIHRDVKPANVLVGENVERVWLTDFGLARAADDARVTRTGAIAGTPHYMSPEQARGQFMDARSDLFSLGGVLYFLCTGRPPFDAATTLGVLHQAASATPRPLTHDRGDLPPKLVRLIERLLAKKPARRPATAAQVADELRLASDQLQRGVQTQKRRRRYKLAGVTGGAFLVIAAGLAGVSFLALPSSPEPSEIHAQPASSVVAPYGEKEHLGDPWSDDWTGAEPSASEQARWAPIVEQVEKAAKWDDAAWRSRVRQFEQTARRLEPPLDVGLMPN